MASASVSTSGGGSSAATIRACSTITCCGRLMGSLEESGLLSFHRRHQHGTVQVFVAPLTRGFRGEQAGVAGCTMQRQAVAVGVMLRAERVRGTELHPLQSLVQVPPERLRLTQAD